jgi:hypothetical protein
MAEVVSIGGGGVVLLANALKNVRFVETFL